MPPPSWLYRATFFPRRFVCIRTWAPGDPEMREEEAVPAEPDNEYGWEKLYSERGALAYSRRYNMQVRIARFQNCYGPYDTWRGGREKAPAAICRKVAEAADGSTIEIWGDGSAVRSYIYVGDIVAGIYALMQSDLEGPVNIGSPEYVTVDELVTTVVGVSGKTIRVKHVNGPVGVQSRNFSHARIESLGWRARVSLRDGSNDTYRWIEAQLRRCPSRGLRWTARPVSYPRSVFQARQVLSNRPLRAGRSLGYSATCTWSSRGPDWAPRPGWRPSTCGVPFVSLDRSCWDPNDE